MAYVIVCKELDLDPYVLPDGADNFAQAQQLMRARAEEFVDEQATVDAENECEVGELVIKLDESGSICHVHPVVDDVERAAVISMSLQAVQIHG